MMISDRDKMKKIAREMRRRQKDAD